MKEAELEEKWDEIQNANKNILVLSREKVENN